LRIRRTCEVEWRIGSVATKGATHNVKVRIRAIEDLPAEKQAALVNRIVSSREAQEYCRRYGTWPGKAAVFIATPILCIALCFRGGSLFAIAWMTTVWVILVLSLWFAGLWLYNRRLSSFLSQLGQEYVSEESGGSSPAGESA
jgi:hypothetical protein